MIIENKTTVDTNLILEDLIKFVKIENIFKVLIIEYSDSIIHVITTTDIGEFHDYFDYTGRMI